MILTTAGTLSTVAASSDIVFGGLGLYTNLSDITTLTDYTEQSDSYYFCKINKIVVDIVRTADEATLNANLRGGDIYINYYPQLTTTPVLYSTLSRDETSYRIDPMTFDTQRIVIDLPDFIGISQSGTTEYWLNATKFNIVGYLQYLSGELAIRTSNSIVNAAAVSLFTYKIHYHVTFSHRK